MLLLFVSYQAFILDTSPQDPFVASLKPQLETARAKIKPESKRETFKRGNFSQKTFKKKEYQKRETKYVKKERPKIELNSATPDDLKTVYGIGEVFSKRIIKFRDYLGGFFSVEQLKEVYKLEEEAYQKIAPQVFVDISQVKKMNVQKHSAYELSKNKYLSYEAMKYLKKHINTYPLEPLKDSLFLKFSDTEIKKGLNYIDFSSE